MAAKFSLSDSLAERQKLTNAQYREIERLYKDLAKKAAKEAERLKSSTLSGKLQAVELGKLEKKLQEEADKIGARLESAIPAAMKKAAAGVVSDAASFQDKLGISIEGAYRHVPTDIVETLVSGKLYKGKWSLSKSIWADVSKTQSDISKVVAEGIALNKSSYDIAKDLEMYVDPSAKKPWDWSKVYPGTKKKIDYNAQRLARTMVGHAYQQSVVAVCKDDPFVDGVEWISGHSTTTCELCRDRNGKVFPAGKLPLDHPNGKCSFAPHISKSLDQIGDDLADWAKGKTNEKMDRWIERIYGGRLSQPSSVQKQGSKSSNSLLSKEVVKAKIDALPQYKDSKFKQNPIPMASREVWYEADDQKRYREENDLGMQWILVSSLETAQSRVSADRLKGMIDNDVPLGTVDGDDEIEVILYDGHYILTNGNHRSSLAKLFGVEKLYVHVRKTPKVG